MEFAYDGGGPGKGGTTTLYVDGAKVSEGRLERTQPIGYSGDETTDVGRDDSSPVTDEYPAGDNDFTGTIKWVELQTGDDDHSHHIDPAQIVHYAMTRQ